MGKVNARRRVSQGLEVEQKNRLEVKGIWHTITLSQSEVRPEQVALVGGCESQLICRPLLPMCQRLPLEAGRCADGTTSDHRLHRCCHCECRQRMSPTQSLPDRVRFPSHYDH